MKKIYNYIIYFLLLTTFVKSIQINAIVFEVSSRGKFSMLVDDFNEYSKKNNLDITLELTIFSSSNSTVLKNGDSVTLQSLLANKSTKYDIYLFFFSDTASINEHLLDLNEYISPEITDMYYSDVFNRTCFYDNRLVGFPLTRSYIALYSNKELLNKYEKPIPKTWEDLLETAEYIEGEEKRNNNTNYISLTGHYKNDKEGLKSFFEVLYSYRKSIELYYPDLKSQEAIEALEMYKRIVNIAISEGYSYILGKLESGEALFIKYNGYIDKYPLYKMSILPGWKDGISSSSIGGTDVGITKYIDENKKKAAIKVLEFWLSKEEQKRMVINKGSISGIKELYYDDEVCSKLDCDLYRNLQLVPQYNQKRKDFAEYSVMLREIVFEFVKGNKTASEVLEEANDLIEIHHLSLDTEETSYGLILFIFITSLLLILIIISLLLNMKKVKPRFEFLPIDFWYIILFGILCHAISIYLDFGETLAYKCRLKVLLYSIGYTFIFVPFLYKLILNFPEENKISKWISKNRYIFLLIFFCIDAVLNLINLGASYDAKTVEFGNGKKFQRCKSTGFLANTIIYSSIVIKLIIITAILFLSFIEWNLHETAFDIHISTSAIYINLLSIIMIIIVRYIKFYSYILYNVLSNTLIIIIILSNYIFFVGIRIALGFIKVKRNSFGNVKAYTSTRKTEKSTSQSIGNTSSVLNKYHKIVKYHYQTNLSESTDIGGGFISNNSSSMQ